jgi:iron complex transport system ATP-binding protein
MNLRAENIVFGYRADQPVLRDVTLDVPPSRVTALFGPNGCGKSTLLRCMNGSLQPQSGRATIDGESVHAQSPQEIAQSIAVVPQETPLDVPFTAGQMVMLGRYARWNLWGRESAEDAAVVQACLARVNATGLADRLFNRLSGGERQRIIVARALAQQGQALLLDEPASHLDISHQLELYRLIRELAREGHAVLMVCHDILIAPLFADQAVLMSNGKIAATGAPCDVLAPGNLENIFQCRVDIDWRREGAVSARFAAANP